MRVQIICVLKDIRKNIKSIVFFIIQMAILTFFTIIVLSELINGINYNNYNRIINEYDLTAFRTYYTNNDYNIDENPTYDVLENYFSYNKASSFVDMYVPDYPNTPVVIGLGMFGKIYDYDDNCNGKVLIGSDVTELSVGDKLEIGELNKLNLSVSKQMKKGSSFFRNTFLDNLDNKILVLLPLTRFMELYDMSLYRSIIQSNLNLIDTHGDLSELIAEIEKTNEIRVIPVDYNDYVSEQNKTINIYTTFFTIVAFTGFIFMFMGLINNLLSLVDNNFTEYSIHQMYGGTLSQLFFRIILYILFITIPSFLIPFNFLVLLQVVSPMPVIIQILGVIAASGIISMAPFYQLKKQNVLYFLRRDV